MKFRIFALALALTIPGFTALAAAPASDWAPSLKSRARLIADGAGQAAFEVELAPGAITYWRDPGDAGVPPVFDFTGSANLARASVEFPAPKRIDEPDGGQAFGYDERVVFPIRVEAADPARPVTLALSANYAVCEKICLPARAKLELTLPTGMTTPFAARIAAARALVPGKADATALGLELTPLDAKDWRLCLPSIGGAPRDLFVEPPPGWWLAAKRQTAGGGQNCFALALREAPAGAAFPVSVRVTITGGASAAETTLALSPGP